MNTLPTMKAQRVARPKKNRLSPITPKTVTSTPIGSKPPNSIVTSTSKTPVTAEGMAIIVRPDSTLVTNSPSRRMGSVCIIPTLRAL